MEKGKLSRFVQKYNLAGLVESVKWETKDNELTTAFISDDKSVLGRVTMKDFKFDDATFGPGPRTREHRVARSSVQLYAGRHFDPEWGFDSPFNGSSFDAR